MMKKRTEDFYKEIMSKLFNEMKASFANEGLDEEYLKLLKFVIQYFYITNY